jgi:hypothetical protein
MWDIFNKNNMKEFVRFILSFFFLIHSQDRDLLESSISQNAFLFFRIVKIGG